MKRKRARRLDTVTQIYAYKNMVSYRSALVYKKNINFLFRSFIKRRTQNQTLALRMFGKAAPFYEIISLFFILYFCSILIVGSMQKIIMFHRYNRCAQSSRFVFY